MTYIAGVGDIATIYKVIALNAGLGPIYIDTVSAIIKQYIFR